MKSAYGLSIPQTPEEVCDPQRLDLLVYDMQVGVLSHQKPNRVIRLLIKVLAAARETGERRVARKADGDHLNGLALPN